ncbi:MAG: hypothetical protein A2413_01910 [Treponema sp. RIFOXYC1_FULL_61_9]|nr:MAG: hypothetical protein A2413_01910 [Treponema sp. RIFOXYC1_FULL_61_9]
MKNQASRTDAMANEADRFDTGSKKNAIALLAASSPAPVRTGSGVSVRGKKAGCIGARSGNGTVYPGTTQKGTAAMYDGPNVKEETVALNFIQFDTGFGDRVFSAGRFAVAATASRNP